jgi:hypothetical protein
MNNELFYYERFLYSLLFSLISFLIWIILRKFGNNKNELKKHDYVNVLYWYYKFKMNLMGKFFLIFSILTLIISLTSLIQFLFNQ